MLRHRSSVAAGATVDRAITDFRRDGFAVARSLFSRAEVAAFQAEAAHLWEVQQGLEAANLRVGLRKDPSGEIVASGSRSRHLKIVRCSQPERQVGHNRRDGSW